MPELGRGYSTKENLAEAKRNKNDEFYTQIGDIMMEFQRCDHLFKGRKILCNCNDGLESQFMVALAAMYNAYQLEGLCGMEYNPGGRGKMYRIDRPAEEGEQIELEDLEVVELEGDGSFDSEEGLALLDQYDLVVTNPPFSRFRDYVKILAERDKDFLIIGNKNALTYKEIFALFMEDRIWTGHTSPRDFDQPEGERKKNLAGLTLWFTNLPISKRNEPLELWREYDPGKYPKYDNRDAVNVNATRDIPVDYSGEMGVPITFLNYYCPEQFKITGFRKGDDGKDLCINGRDLYSRVLIRHKNQKEDNEI